MRDFTELVCWKLAHELKCLVFDFTSDGPASRDFKFRDQIRESSASAASNIAEGFGVFRPAEFARFLGYAIASLDETKNHLLDGLERHYLPENAYKRLHNLAAAAKRVTNNLKRDRERKAAEERNRKRAQPRRARNRSPPA